VLDYESTGATITTTPPLSSSLSVCTAASISLCASRINFGTKGNVVGISVLFSEPVLPPVVRQIQESLALASIAPCVEYCFKQLLVVHVDVLERKTFLIEIENFDKVRV
jgi:hypothetical protein